MTKSCGNKDQIVLGPSRPVIHKVSNFTILRQFSSESISQDLFVDMPASCHSICICGHASTMLPLLTSTELTLALLFLLVKGWRGESQEYSYKYCFLVECKKSTPAVGYNYLLLWWSSPLGLNPCPHDYEVSALTTTPTRQSLPKRHLLHTAGQVDGQISKL